MSLQIWLPLDGSLENKGVGDLTITSSVLPTYYSKGKIGKAYNLITQSTFNSNSLSGKKCFTIAFWANVLSSETLTADWKQIIGFRDANTARGVNGRFRFEGCYTNTTGKGVHWHNNGELNIVNASWYPNPQEKDVWHHYCVVVDSENYIKSYIDGRLDATTNKSVMNGGWLTGEFWIGDTNNIEGMINDVRVYDTCLSAAEVKEIAQGLVLHYKLSPYLNWLDYTQQKSITRGSGNNFTDYTYNSALKNCTDTQYTVDFDAKGTADDMNIDIYFRDSSGAAYAATAQQIITTNWKHYTLTINGSPENLVLFRVRLYGGTAGDIAYFKNMRLTSANMPYTESYFSDSSGYGRHGKVEGIIQFSTDSPRYSCSYIMDGLVANRIHYDEGTFNYGENDDFSYALWVKPNRTGDAQQYVFTNGRADAGEYGYGIYCPNDTTLRIRYGSGTNSANDLTIVKNQWVHVAFTKSNNTIKIYKNGELTITRTSIGVYPTYGDGKGLGLGNFHYSSSDIYPAYGNISDFRIYCTPLSAEAIRDLYQTSLKIDKDGKDHSFEFIEDDGLNITKTSELISSNFIESGYNFYEGGDISYKPTNRSNATCPYNGVVNLSSVADLGLPISLNLEADFSWKNFAFDTSATTTLLQTQGDSRLKSDNTFTWTNGINNTLRLESYVSTLTSGTVHISGIKTITVDKFNTLNGFHFGMRCDYSDGNGTLSLSNIKVTLADDITKFTKSYVSANEFIEK